MGVQDAENVIQFCESFLDRFELMLLQDFNDSKEQAKISVLSVKPMFTKKQKKNRSRLNPNS